MEEFLQAAIDEARQGLAEGGIPIGSVVVHAGRIVGRGHNRRVQSGSAILHAEMDALERVGRKPAAPWPGPGKQGRWSDPSGPWPRMEPRGSGCRFWS
jgi:tRNA(Arg) A34 adenosine deaminase TadA